MGTITYQSPQMIPCSIGKSGSKIASESVNGDKFNGAEVKRWAYNLVNWFRLPAPEERDLFLFEFFFFKFGLKKEIDEKEFLGHRRVHIT